MESRPKDDSASYGRGIDPDGKVLVTSLLGRRWHNIEVELSDTSKGRTRAALREVLIAIPKGR